LLQENADLWILSFIIPIKLESKDRLRNCITVLSYLLNKVPEANIFLKEVDVESNFLQYALPEIKKNANVDNLNHTFQQNPC